MNEMVCRALVPMYLATASVDAHVLDPLIARVLWIIEQPLLQITPHMPLETRITPTMSPIAAKDARIPLRLRSGGLLPGTMGRVRPLAVCDLL